MKTLTKKEESVLSSFEKCDFFDDGYDSVIWLVCFIDTACEHTGLNEKAVGGVLTNLQKKEYIFMSIYPKHPSDNCIHLEQSGKDFFNSRNSLLTS